MWKLVQRTLALPYRILSSHGLAVGILLFLMLLTFLGTWHQIDHGLFSAKQKYFDSLVWTLDLPNGIKIPLPGAYLLLAILAANLVVGGILRARKGWAQAGVLIAHFGILFMLFAGFVTFHHSVDGHLTLYEKERSSEFVSYHEWELAISERNPDGTLTEHLVPGREFAHLRPGESAVFRSADLPFDVGISDFLENCDPLPAGPFISQGRKVIDGVVLFPRERDPENERNVAGAVVTVTPKAGGPPQEGLVAGLSRGPWSFEVDGKPWGIELRRRRFALPFTIVLDDFTRELHPRTAMASAFMSDVTMIEGETAQKIHISMNKPLRHRGFTLYQASWGPSNAGPSDPLFSTFAVVRNPADQFPLIACIIITFGLVFHFSQKLLRYLRTEARRPA